MGGLGEIRVLVEFVAFQVVTPFIYFELTAASTAEWETEENEMSAELDRRLDSYDAGGNQGRLLADAIADIRKRL